jgi:hypothetical protein
MATSPTFNTPDRIIRMALYDCGLIGQGEDPNGEQLADGLTRLNDLINLWGTQGLKLWLQADQAVSLVAGQGTYTLKVGGDVNIVKPLRVIGGYYKDANDNQRPISPMSRDEYMRLSNVSTRGAINAYFVEKLATQLSVSFWLVPDAEAAMGTAQLIIQQQAPNMVNLNESLQFPQEWFMALRWGLADDMCTGQPSEIMQRCAMRATAYRTALEDWDVEDASTSFEPDPRIGFSSSNFR